MRPASLPQRSTGAFTLMEVMIAFGIFFVAVFAILGVISNGLKNARALQHRGVDAGMVASEIATNQALEEGLESGDFGEMYPNYSWTADIYEVQSNHLYQVDIIVQGDKGKVDSQLSILLYRPNSKPGSLDGGVGAGGGFNR